DAPSHPDTEKTIADVRKRIASTTDYLDTYKAADFDGIDSRTVSLPRWEGKSMAAADYFIEHAMPNFFFHVTTSYAILRHVGGDVTTDEDWQHTLREWARVTRDGGAIVLVDRGSVRGRAPEASRRALCAGLTELEQRRVGRLVITSGLVTHM